MAEETWPASFGLAFHHFGLATRSAERTLSLLRGLGYRVPAAVHDPLQNVNLVMCDHEHMPAVEVIFEAGPDGPLQAILAQQPESIYHLCFASADAERSLAAIRAAGHRVLPVVPAKPAVLFGGRPVSFHMVRGIGLIEIVEG